MRTRVCVLALIAMVILSGVSCTPGMSSPTRGLTNSQDWTPPVFPGAVADDQMQANMTAVAATPEGLDDTACLCFGFPVQDAVFYAYRSDARSQEIIEFYSEQMADDGWQEIATDPSDTTIPHRIWQRGESSPLVAYLMVTPTEGNTTLIYISVAERVSQQEIRGD
jgi:hypothetical protein